MLHRRVNDHDMVYIELGKGPPLVCVHGTLGDFRVWSPVLGPLSLRHRVFSLSLRHFFPEHWDGTGLDFTISQHVADVISFIEKMEEGTVDLMGHSRGGHIAFRVAQERPDLLHRLILADPTGQLDASLSANDTSSAPVRSTYTPIADRVVAGDIDGALAMFCEAANGPGSWLTLSATARQTWRDNVNTLLGQVNELRAPFTLFDAESLGVPTLFVGGSDSPPNIAIVLRALAAHVPGASIQMISGAGHFMFEDDPISFCAAVVKFLEEE